MSTLAVGLAMTRHRVGRALDALARQVMRRDLRLCHAPEIVPMRMHRRAIFWLGTP